MSILNPAGVPCILSDGVEHRFLFSLNAIDEIEDSTEKTLRENIVDLTNEKTNRKALRDIVCALVNDENGRNGDKTRITTQEAGYLITLDNMLSVTQAVLEAYGISMPDKEDLGDDDGGKNSKGGRQKN